VHLTAALLVLSLSSAPAGASPPLKSEQLVELDEAGRSAQADHMWRLVALSGAQLAAGGGALGAGLALAQPTVWGFGAQLIGWGLIDLAIAGAGLAFLPSPSDSRSELVARELLWSDILLLNAGLDVGYMLVGATLVVLGLMGAPFGEHLVGHGAAVIVGGAGLLVLDLVAWWEALDRRAALAGVTE
jgi:hypothetical protein